MVVMMMMMIFFLQNKITFQKIKHVVTKVDCQPTAENGVLVLVTGRLQV